MKTYSVIRLLWGLMATAFLFTIIGCTRADEVAGADKSFFSRENQALYTAKAEKLEAETVHRC